MSFESSEFEYHLLNSDHTKAKTFLSGTHLLVTFYTLIVFGYFLHS